MRAIIFICAIAALLGSYGANASPGAGDPRNDDPVRDVNNLDALIAAQADLDPGRSLALRRRASSSGTADAMALDSGYAVQTRIRTCQGVTVTITSFGGGDWVGDLDGFCDEPAPSEDVTASD